MTRIQIKYGNVLHESVSRGTSKNLLEWSNMAYNKNIVPQKKNARRIGDIGEQIAVKYLKSKGFQTLETNYLKKWGELDIVAKKDGVIHVIEVKTHSYESKQHIEDSLRSDIWRPEEMVDDRKLYQIRKTTNSWILESDWEGEVQMGVIAVRMAISEQYAVVNYIEQAI